MKSKKSPDKSVAGSYDEMILTILQNQQKLVEKSIDIHSIQEVNHDSNFEHESWRNINDRDAAYTGLLEHYTRISQIRNYVKEFHKWIFFWIIMIIMIFFGVYVFRLLKTIDLSQKASVENLVMIISVLVSFSTVAISIPKIITKYLFSSKEDKRIADIILHTQDHDSSGRQWALDYKKNAILPVNNPDENFNEEKQEKPSA